MALQPIMIEILPITRVHAPPPGSKGSDVIVEKSAGGPPSFRDAVLYPTHTELEVRNVESAGGSAFRLTVRGAPRSVLRPGSFVLSAPTEFFVTRWALVRGVGGVCHSGSWSVSQIPGDAGGELPLGTVRCELRPLGGTGEGSGSDAAAAGAPDGILELRAEVPLPFIPGRRYTLSGAGAGAGASRGAGAGAGPGSACEVMVALAGPKPAEEQTELLPSLVSELDPTDSRATERALLELYGITPRMEQPRLERRMEDRRAEGARLRAPGAAVGAGAPAGALCPPILHPAFQARLLHAR
ncbi:MAG: hypothetical protein R6V29_12675, partial [Spirochaetia bacterium]